MGKTKGSRGLQRINQLLINMWESLAIAEAVRPVSCVLLFMIIRQSSLIQVLKEPCALLQSSISLFNPVSSYLLLWTLLNKCWGESKSIVPCLGNEHPKLIWCIPGVECVDTKPPSNQHMDSPVCLPRIYRGLVRSLSLLNPMDPKISQTPPKRHVHPWGKIAILLLLCRFPEMRVPPSHPF